MAQRFVTDEGVLVIPGAYPSIKVQKQNSGLATTGVVFLVGEADSGPAWSQELDLSVNFYAPTELSAVIAKYKSGNIVDAFRGVANPANDTNINGSPSFIYVVKTNASAKASGSLLRSGFAAYGVLADKSFGKLGNLIYSNVTSAQAEVAPTTGLFAYIPGPNLGGSDGATLGVRVNGGAKTDVSIAALTSPAALVPLLNAVQGVLATGGQDRLTAVAITGTLALAATGTSVVITSNTAWAVVPSVGDTMVIPKSGEFGASGDSILSGGGHQNNGSYIVTGATAATITATKLRDATGAGAPTSPINISATAVGTPTNDLLCYAPINVQNVSGADRGLLTGLVAKTVVGTASGQSLQLVLQTGAQWNALPQVGDLVQIPSTSPAGILASNANLGWFVVTAATTGVGAGATSVTMTRLSNGAPASFSATAIAAVGDIVCRRPALDGTGKALELYDDLGSVNVNTQLFTLAGAAVSWLSTAPTPLLLTSASELAINLNINRQADGVAEVINAGGNVVLLVGYLGTTASLTIGATTLTTSVSGGTGANLSLVLADFKRLGDLAQYINSQTGYTCSVATAIWGQISPLDLDQGTFNIASDLGSKPGRIKNDAADFFDTLDSGSSTAQLGTTVVVRAAGGLPDVQATFYLAGGTLGATTAQNATDAISALEKLRGNFVVPLFSRDATADITDGLTDAGSSYTISGIHAAVSSHVLKMSKLKTRRHRQGFVSFRGSFANAKLAAQNIANYRVACAIQDVKALAGDGTIQQFQPWMASVLAAGMQAAGFYRSLVFKGINASGALMADGSFTDQSDADLEAAIENGIMAIQRPDSGAIRWNSDQTTYATDESFVYNSVQAIYASDTIALTVAQRMENAFVGQSVADVSASLALTYLQGIMSDMKRLKLIAASDDAPLGYRNAQITISGNAMKVEVEIKLAGAILFIPITFLVTQVTQTATQQ